MDSLLAVRTVTVFKYTRQLAICLLSREYSPQKVSRKHENNEQHQLDTRMCSRI